MALIDNGTQCEPGLVEVHCSPDSLTFLRTKWEYFHLVSTVGL